MCGGGGGGGGGIRWKGVASLLLPLCPEHSSAPNKGVLGVVRAYAPRSAAGCHSTYLRGPCPPCSRPACSCPTTSTPAPQLHRPSPPLPLFSSPFAAHFPLSPSSCLLLRNPPSIMYVSPSSSVITPAHISSHNAPARSPLLEGTHLYRSWLQARALISGARLLRAPE